MDYLMSAIRRIEPLPLLGGPKPPKTAKIKDFTRHSNIVNVTPYSDRIATEFSFSAVSMVSGYEKSSAAPPISTTLGV